MWVYVIRRLIQTVVVLLIVSIVSFVLLHMTPGDPAAAMLGTEASIDQIKALQRELWLDRPIAVQYVHWLGNAVRGDLGISIMYKEPTVEMFAAKLPITLYLSGVSLLLSTLIGITAGVICAIRRGGWLDQLVSLIANLGMGMPIFWLGILGVYVFGYKLGWLPIQGWTSPFDDLVENLKCTIMPAILLAIPGVAVMTRQTRSSMLEVIHQDYIRTAFAKGLTETVIIFKHALKNALIPVITLLGLQVRILVGGSVLVETVFNIPGMGRLLVSGALNKDFLIVQAGVLLIGLMVGLANLLVDISYVWLDPRVRNE
ncbi:MAG TPA: ABC transporter permease [Syntrophorhabdaceae bacterium]|nr:ABC transporter permease [Syntrophorhabdaceae bacterium]